MVGTVGKPWVELCGADQGCESLGRTVLELLAKNSRPIRRQHERVPGSGRISGTEGRRDPVPLAARSEGDFLPVTLAWG